MNITRTFDWGKCLAVFFLFNLVIYGGWAQSVKKVAPPPSVDDLQAVRDAQTSPHAKVYANAMQLGDMPTAITALHYLLLEEPENHFYLDSLAGLYAKTGNIGACKLLSESIRKTHPDDIYILSLLSNIYQSTGQAKEALECFERLEKNTGMAFYGYQVAVMRYQLDRLGECRTAIEKLLALPENQEEYVIIYTDNEKQTVPLKAAALNLRGNLELKLGKKEAAKADFEAALKIAPEFLLPQGNLEANF